MPGCGKSTVGVLLAKSMLMDFVDTDLIIQKKCGKGLCEIIDEKGLSGFEAIEEEVLSGVFAENTVIATGGSAVYCKNGMENLKKNGAAVYLKLSPEDIVRRIDNITTRGIVMRKGSTIADLYAERAPLYEKYADLTLDCTGLNAEECVSRLHKMIKEH